MNCLIILSMVLKYQGILNYDVIKELLIALLLKAGLKSANHECLISYFQTHYPQYEYETSILSELKNIRNRITYDGIFVEKSYLDKNRLEFEHIISLLLNMMNQEIISGKSD